ncbi:MAG: glycosyltransferase family 2 protein [bacterium]
MLSLIIPALNEASGIRETLQTAAAGLKKAGIEHEIIVVNDGSSDDTARLAAECGASVITHPCPGGYGRSIKDGILKARHDLIAIADADGTYPVEKLPDLYRAVKNEGYDMAVGARRGNAYRGTFLKMPARLIFIWLCEYATGGKIDDINSGLRVFKKELPLQCWARISNGFSFTTTITLAALLEGRFIKYIPADYHERKGRSHIRYLRDTMRTLQIIVEDILYYNPLKLFLLVTNVLFGISILAFALFFLIPDSPRLSLFAGMLSVFSFCSAFLAAAIGMAADVARMAGDRK